MYRIYLKWHNYWWGHYLDLLCKVEGEKWECRPDTKAMSDKMEYHWDMANCYETAIKQKRGNRKWLRKKQNKLK